MKKQHFNKDILTLSILTMFTVFTWIGFSIYRTFRKPLMLKIPPEQLKSLNPDLDKQILNSLKKRKKISLQEMNSVPELIEFQLEPKEATSSMEKEASQSGEKSS